MSSFRPKKGTAEYAEQCTDDPSDFIHDEPEEGNTATKVVVNSASAKYEKEIGEQLGSSRLSVRNRLQLRLVLSRLLRLLIRVHRLRRLVLVRRSSTPIL